MVVILEHKLQMVVLGERKIWLGGVDQVLVGVFQVLSKGEEHTNARGVDHPLFPMIL